MARKKKEDAQEDIKSDARSEADLSTQHSIPEGRTRRQASRQVSYHIEDLEDFANEEFLGVAAAIKETKGKRQTKGKKGCNKEESDDDHEAVAASDSEDEVEEEEDEEAGPAVGKRGKTKKAGQQTASSAKSKDAAKPGRKSKVAAETKPSKAPKKDAKTSKKDAKGAKKDTQFDGPPDEVILNYLKVQNRPFSVNDVFNNMHGAIGKTQVLKSLTKLVSQGDAVTKMYGKQSVYVVRQDNLEKPSQAELDRMDNEIDGLKTQLNAEKDACKLITTQLQQTKATPTTESAKQLVDRLQEETNQLKTRLTRIEADGAKGNIFPEDEKRKLNILYEMSRQEWSKRKRMCVDALETIIDGLMNAGSESGGANAKKKMHDYVEEIGVETDGQMGVDIKLDPLAAV